MLRNAFPLVIGLSYVVTVSYTTHPGTRVLTSCQHHYNLLVVLMEGEQRVDDM